MLSVLVKNYHHHKIQHLCHFLKVLHVMTVSGTKIM